MKWTCPHCNAKNEDEPEETGLPLCGDCDKETEWAVIEAQTA